MGRLRCLCLELDHGFENAIASAGAGSKSACQRRYERLLSIHGGADGMRDSALLESAPGRPRQMLAYADQPDIIDPAAAYTFGIARNHPFVDGNKRTGFVVGILFIELNGHRFTASEEDAAQAVLQLASGVIDAADYAAFLRLLSR